MDFLSPIITPIVESLLVPVKEHLGFFVSSTKHVKEMGERIIQLNDTSKDVENKKETANVNNQVVPQHVGRWLEDVQKINEEANSIPTTGMGCFNVANKYRGGKRSCDVLKKIEDLETRESKIKWTNQKKPLAKVTSTSTPVHDDDITQIRFESRDLVFKAALKSLQLDNETHKMIALCGMGGVGKTTMMEQLKEAVEKSKMFDWVLKVVLGEDTNTITIQQAIAENLSEALTETTLEARADRLGKMFDGTSEHGKKKILVIMDDLWKEVDLKDFGLRRPLPNGFKLLFTSRFENVCTQMGVRTESILKVGVLNDEEAKMLFFKIVEQDCNDPEFYKIGEDIVKKCGGLPIAIKTIASNLRGEIKDAWQDSLSNLQRHDLQDLDSITESVFEMSYNNLKKEDEKAIFLLSGLFPEDFDIHIEDLMRYGWGMKLFDKMHTIVEARRRTNTCINKLVRANLLMQSDRAGYVRMHDLMRDFVLTNLTKAKQASIVNHEKVSLWLTQDANMSYGRILLKCKGMSKFSAQLNYPNLSFLMLMDGDKGLKFPEDFYERMRKLEVVAYERMHTPLHLVRFEFLTELRTLHLRSCSLTDDFSFLESLKNLETLSFADCKIRKLPSTMGKLKRLKLLDVTGCVDLSIDDGVFKNLDSLEELYMKVFDYKAIRFTDANCEELKILSERLFGLELEFFENKAQPKNVFFKQLKRFRISIGCKLTLDHHKYYTFRNTLELKANCEELLECEISELFEKTEELHLVQVNDMTNIKDVSKMHLFKHSFGNLKNLVVSECSQLTYIFTIPMASGLGKLERLAISDCPKLVSLCEPTENEIKLPQMLELILVGLPNFISIYPANNNASAAQSFFDNKLWFPKLEKLEVSMMKNLKQIWPCQITATNDKNKAVMLKEIRVRNCESLENLFPRNPLPLLNNLQVLEVENCGSIEVLFNMDLEIVCEMEEESSSSRRSSLRKIKVDGLGKLRELWRIEGVLNDSVLINNFKGVENIEIEDCRRFTNIFTPTTTKFDLGGVTTYISKSTAQDLEDSHVMGENKLVECSQQISEIMDENSTNPIVIYTSQLMHTCHNLENLELSDDPRVEVLFEMDTPSTSCRSEVATIRDTQQQQLLLLGHRRLKFLQLYSLKEMSHVWKCNWNKLSIPPQPFHNLTRITLSYCNKINYLFSPVMAKFLSNLKDVEIAACDGMEEVISSRDDETSTSSHTMNTSYFPHLDTLRLRSMPRLKRIDDQIQYCGDEEEEVMGDATNWSLCQYPKMIHVWGCDALSTLIPCYAVGKMENLQELQIWECRSMREVFEISESSRMRSCSSSSTSSRGSKYVTTTTTIHEANTIASPPLESIITRPQLSNLKDLVICDCDLLQHVFTFSTLESLRQLKKLSVVNCKALTRVVVTEEEKEEEEINGNKASSSESVGVVVVVFPRLERLVLEDLPKLEGFFLGSNNIHFRWPLLVYVKVSNCPQMTVFTCGESKTPNLNYIHGRLGKYSVDEECGLNFHGSGGTTNQLQDVPQATLFSNLIPTGSNGMPWSFHNLIEIDIDEGRDVETIIPSNALLQLQMLEKIYLNGCSNVKEVFEVASLEGRNSESQTVVNIPNLKQVELVRVYDLKYIWKSNQGMVLQFPNLTSVSIYDCTNLEHVFTCSMVDSLVQLQYLSITDCKNIEVIFKKEEGDDIAKVNEILLLPRLMSIKLEKLPSLAGFCLGEEVFSWPLLHTLEIKECPTITLFTKGHLDTPKELKVVDTSFGMCHVKEDLNSFIKTKQKEGMFGRNRVI